MEIKGMKNLYFLLLLLILISCSTVKLDQEPKFLYLNQIKFNQVYLNNSTVQGALSPAMNDSLIIDVILDSTKSIDVRLAFINALDSNLIDSALCSKVEEVIYNEANKGKVKFVFLDNDAKIDVNLGIYNPADLGCLAYLNAIANKDVPKYSNQTITYFEFALSKLEESITLKAIYLQYKIQLYYNVLGAYSAFRYYQRKNNEIKDFDLGFQNKTYDLFENNFKRLKNELEYDKTVLEMARTIYDVKNYNDSTKFLDQYYADIAFNFANKIRKKDSIGVRLLFTVFARDMATGYILKTELTNTFNAEYYFLFSSYFYNTLNLFELALPNCAIFLENENQKVKEIAKEQYNYATKKIKYYEIVREEYGKTKTPKTNLRKVDCSSIEEVNSNLPPLIIALKQECYDEAIKMINNGAKVDLDTDSINSPFSYIYNRGNGIQWGQKKIRKVLLENAIIQYADRIAILPDSLKKNIKENLKYHHELFTLYKLYDKLKIIDSLQKLIISSSKSNKNQNEIQFQINSLNEISENKWVLFNKATEYYETERYEESLDCINKGKRMYLITYYLRGSNGDANFSSRTKLHDKLQFLKYKVLKASGKKEEALSVYNEYYNEILSDLERELKSGKQNGFKEYSEASLLIDIAYCNAKLKNFALAEKFYYKSINASNDGLMEWHKLANLKYIEKKYDEALSLFDDLIQIDTQDYMNSNFYKGKCYKKMNKKHDAMLCFAKAVKIDSNRAPMWQDCAEQLSDLGYYEIAINYYKTAIAIDRDSYYHIDTARCWNNLGYLYEKTENYDLAIDYFTKSIEFDNTYPYPYWGLASCKAAQKDTLKSKEYYETTIKLFKERIKKDPINIEYRETLAYIMLQNEMYNDAINEINKSLPIAYGVNERILLLILKLITEEILELDPTQTKAEVDSLIHDTDLEKRYDLEDTKDWVKSTNIKEQSKLYILEILKAVQPK